MLDLGGLITIQTDRKVQPPPAVVTKEIVGNMQSVRRNQALSMSTGTYTVVLLNQEDKEHHQTILVLGRRYFVSVCPQTDKHGLSDSVNEKKFKYRNNGVDEALFLEVQ